MNYYFRDVVLKNGVQLIGCEVSTCDPAGILAVPHEIVSANGHSVLRRKSADHIARSPVERLGTRLNRPELHCVFRLNLVEFARGGGGVLGFAQMSRSNGRADFDAALIGGFAESLGRDGH